MTRQGKRLPAALLHLFVLFGVLAAGCTTYSRRTVAKDGAEAPSGPAPLSAREFESRVDALSRFAHAVHLDFSGEPAQATSEYLRAASADPANEELALDVARRLIREQKPSEAIELLEKRIKQNDASGAAHGLLALAYHQGGKTNEAIGMSLKAIEKSPQSLASYQHLAQLYLQMGRTNEVLNLLDRAAAQKEASVEFHLTMAELIARLQVQQVLEMDMARPRIMAALDNAAGKNPDNPLFQQRLADFYLMYGEIEKAEPLYAQLLRDFPEAPGVREKLANIYLRLEKKEQATELLEDMARDKPTDPQNYYFLGSLAFDGQDFTKAAEYYERAIKLNPGFEPVYYDLAGVNIARNRPQEALAVLDQARSRFNQLNFTLEFYTGVAQAQLERYKEAISHLVSAELLAKTTEPARLNHIFYYQLGSTHERMGEIDQAVKAFRKALEISPDYPDAMNYLGYMWAERGENLEEARKLIERAIELEPENAAFLDSMAWVLFKLGQPKEALPHMEKALSFSEEADPTLYDHLGDIQAALQNYPEARAAYEKALEGKPDEAIRQKLEDAERRAGSGPRAGQSLSLPE